MPVYQLEKLMDETRRIATEYRASTGATLPVSGELAKFDAIRLLGLEPPGVTERAVDALLKIVTEDQKVQIQKVQIKGRVIFNPEKPGYRIGQLNLDADWYWLVLVLMNDKYETTEIYRLQKSRLIQELADKHSNKKSRGAISVRKFKAIAELCWRSGNH